MGLPIRSAPFTFKEEITSIEGMKKKNQQVVFKPNNMGQLQLPMDLEELIPENHLVRMEN
jgi:hypothetical protein